ncbi:MAG: DNA-binding protein [Proteobacteria bacterium]|nr:DNA-binding protein [Pseudomonadota bacterium]
MAQLIVRNLDAAVVRALKLRAAEKGTSAEAEHREILRAALLGTATATSLKGALRSMPDVGEDADFELERELDRSIELDRRSALPG